MFQVDPWSPVVTASVFLLVVGMTLWAGLVPALRAGRTDPRSLLRIE
jgi:ABC-type lipoprotein release transport system permease subunit